MSDNATTCICSEVEKLFFHREPKEDIEGGELGEYLTGPFYRCPCGQIWTKRYPVWVKSSKEKQEEWIHDYHAGKT
jgi:hypothetical protein